MTKPFNMVAFVTTVLNNHNAAIAAGNRAHAAQKEHHERDQAAPRTPDSAR